MTSVMPGTDRDSTLPLLYIRREYVAAEDGGTTTCRATTTNPVAEYTPDD